MRKFTAILLLVAFTAVQYDRYISYMECRIVNYLAATAATCDCEKVLQKDNTGHQPSVPAAHQHDYTDKLYYRSCPYLLSFSVIDAGHVIIPYHASLSDGVCDGIDHPPPAGISFSLFI